VVRRVARAESVSCELVDALAQPVASDGRTDQMAPVRLSSWSPCLMKSTNGSARSSSSQRLIIGSSRRSRCCEHPKRSRPLISNPPGPGMRPTTNCSPGLTGLISGGVAQRSEVIIAGAVGAAPPRMVVFGGFMSSVLVPDLPPSVAPWIHTSVFRRRRVHWTPSKG
jgi:hypothetical protein